MKSSIQQAAILLVIVNNINGQTLPDSEARLIAWKAYGNFVTDMLTAGQPLQLGKDFVYVNPPNQAAVRGGTPCPQSVTNFDLFSVADNMQNTGEPLMDPNGPSYVDNLYNYLETVDLKTATPTQDQLNNITALQDDLHVAQDKADAEAEVVYTRYLNDVRAQASNQAFGSWVTQHAPLLTAYNRQVQSADAALQQYEIKVFGPQYRTVTTQRNKIDNQARDELFAEPGYNMPVYTNPYSVSISPWYQNELSDGIIYKPSYTLGNSFEESCDAWFNNTSAARTKFSWNMNSVNGHDWSSLGHTKGVTKFGGSYFALLSAKKTGTSEETVFNSWSSGFSESISLELSMKGAPLVFTIGSGLWDVGGVRTTYPSILPSKLDTLASRVRLTKLLIGYEIGLKITINETSTWHSVYNFVSDAKKNTGGGFSIWGIHFGAGGNKETGRNISEVQFVNNGVSGQIIIPPSQKGVTYLLGALGKAL
ncbi:hypothetical protein WAI453_009523 [Rhynchosporium graminicola]|uniref:Uncharacterized protein n=1 Tax=Rhynchosporium graminicola TaxID=2792576 RepID=A0A1E1KST0_9HELO|nr:uncharacterized protein RCO7_02788 [Rhynchosporium commune]